MRFEDESEAIRDAASAESADLAAAVTSLAEPAVLLTILAVVFWVGNRRRTALVLSYGVAALGFYVSLEALLGLPHSLESALLAPAEVGADGFPSGHAFGAMVVYGGLVGAYERLRDPLAVAIAGALIVAVSLSRVILGTHYLGDVLVGAALGVGFVIAMNRLTRGAPVVGFLIAAVLAGLAVFLPETAAYDVLALGAALGGLLTAGWIDRLPSPRSRLEAAVLVVAGVAVVAAIRLVETALEFAPLLVALYAAFVAWVVFAPELVGRLSSALDRTRVES
nr:phosphatase PAP2 family protein [Natronolimnohabitans innermongolicus]